MVNLAFGKQTCIKQGFTVTKCIPQHHPKSVIELDIQQSSQEMLSKLQKQSQPHRWKVEHLHPMREQQQFQAEDAGRIGGTVQAQRLHEECGRKLTRGKLAIERLRVVAYLLPTQLQSGGTRKCFILQVRQLQVQTKLLVKYAPKPFTNKITTEL